MNKYPIYKPPLREVCESFIGSILIHLRTLHKLKMLKPVALRDHMFKILAYSSVFRPFWPKSILSFPLFNEHIAKGFFTAAIS